MLKVNKDRLIVVNLLLLLMALVAIVFIIWTDGSLQFIAAVIVAILAWIASDLARQVAIHKKEQ